ncbi:MAG: aminotransferase class V-fold PLP-dependent enzyme [Candidatus Brocadiaceae bacterium]|jgi:selenocysteine lyase/cysteine desulfurase
MDRSAHHAERAAKGLLTWEPSVSLDTVRDHVVGLGVQVPLHDGTRSRYVNLDNAATTPALQPVLDCVDRFQRDYSSVHRGSGFKSLLSTHVYRRCRQIAGAFIGADPNCHSVLFTQNATHSLNKLARRLSLRPEDVVVGTLMEHHSNILPWRFGPCRYVCADIRRRDGTLDVADLEAKLRRHAGHLKVVSVTGGSNVTGVVPPYRRIARMAHRYGAWFVLDATQVVPRRRIAMGAPDDPERIDFLAFSGHKMYAPFGAGVLAGRKEVFQQGAPDVVGGGTVHAVTDEEVVWQPPPEREESGTPNLNGAVALARAAQVLQELGMEGVAEHERELTRYCLRRLLDVEGLRLYGQKDPEIAVDRLGVFALDAPALGHSLLAAVLGYEWGIGVRNGCFCAQPYVRELLGIPREQMRRVVRKLAKGDHATVPGLVRVSLGIYNTRAEIDYLIEALRAVLAEGPRARYVIDPRHLDHVPEDWEVDYDDFLPFPPAPGSTW